MAETNKETSASSDAGMSNFKLRMALLRIWVLKNASLLLKIAIILAVAALVLCITLIPQFRDWIIGLNGDGAAITWEKIIGYFTGAASATGATLLLVYKVKKVTIEDIKKSSRSVKEAMVKYGYCFNKDGKLVHKKLQSSSSEDTDNTIGIDSVSANGGVIVGTIRAAQELSTVMKADVANGDTVDTVSKKIDASDSTDAVSDVEGSLLSDDESSKKIAEKIDSISDSTAEIVGTAVENSEVLSKASDETKTSAGKATKVAVKSLFKDIWADIVYFWRKVFKKKAAAEISGASDQEDSSSQTESESADVSDSSKEAETATEEAAASETAEPVKSEPEATAEPVAEKAEPAKAEEKKEIDHRVAGSDGYRSVDMNSFLKNLGK
jgi:hypothetical protein